MKRLISDPNLNTYEAYGRSEHKKTSCAPISMYNIYSEDVVKNTNEKFEQIKINLKDIVGDPFYAKNNFIIYNIDSLEFLSRIKNSVSFDLTVTSPPYNIGKEYEKKLEIEEYLEWCANWMNLIYSCTKENGSFWLNLGYFEVPERGLCVPISYLLWDKSLFYLLQEIVWTYGAGVTSKFKLSPRNEKWLYYVRNSKSYTFNLDAIRDPNVKYPNQKKNGKFRCNPLGKNPSDVWDIPKVTTGSSRSSRERTSHPAQFPLRVVERIVLASSNVAEVVFDPFAGSCSTGIASAGLSRVFVGTEINKTYCKLSVERFEAFEKERKEYQSNNRLLFLI